MEPHAEKREDWAASPVPSAWLQNALLSVDPVTHARVRALPAASLDADVNRVESDDDDDDDDDEDLKQRGDGESDDLWTEMKSSASRAQPQLLVAPQPRRVVSPELIFSSAAESLSRHKRLRFSQTSEAAGGFDASRLGLASHFRPIVADRPDVALTSPPSRAANPVVLDSRFRNPPKRLDREPPLQPFYPRATRRPQFHPSSA